MAYELHPGLSFCDTGSQVIFIDLAQDRYFRLPPALEDAFRTFADRGRYAETAIEALLRARIVQTAAVPRPPEQARVPRAEISFEPGERPSALGVARALSLDMIIARQLRRGRLARQIEALQRHKQHRNPTGSVADRGPRSIVAAYAAARLFRSPAGRCLSRSIAMARHLSAAGCASTLVIGVRAEPFAAHSWVQADHIVLNDTPEEVTRFTPILAV